jgi:hypothetical protein
LGLASAQLQAQEGQQQDVDEAWIHRKKLMQIGNGEQGRLGIDQLCICNMLRALLACGMLIDDININKHSCQGRIGC